MPEAHIAFDTRSGRILSVHHGASNSADAKRTAHEHSKVALEHVEVVKEDAAFARGKRYRIDPVRKALVEAGRGEEGSGFGFGSTGRFG